MTVFQSPIEANDVRRNYQLVGAVWMDDRLGHSSQVGLFKQGIRIKECSRRPRRDECG